MINVNELASSLAMVMTDKEKEFFIHLFESGKLDASKSLVKSKALKHATEQQIIGSMAVTSKHMQDGISEIAYDLLENNTELAFDKDGRIVEVAL